MVDDADLQGLDPYDLMDGEAARLDRFFASLDASKWSASTRCAGWSVRDLLAHLLSSEQYNAACLDGSAAEFLASLGARGATDLAAANELGIRDLDDQSPAQMLDEWRIANARTRRAFREHDGGDIDSSVGPYPARWQAFHLAFELATHADDAGVPVAPSEAASRIAWQAQFGRFALKELDGDLDIKAGDGTTLVQGDGVTVELPDDQFVQAVAGRMGDDGPLDADQLVLLSATP